MEQLRQRAMEALKTYFGYASFKKGQEEIVASILKGQDTLAVLPTGGGKSVCYQIPSILLDGFTLVVSPLISLMKDQVDTLNNLGISSTYINSSLEPREMDERMIEIEQGRYKLVYIAPERLESEKFLAAMRRLRVSLLAVDEAHCISQWGHDFRPSYMNINRFIRKLADRPIIAAFTATATGKVMEDIVSNLRLKRPQTVKTGYGRDNLSFSVVKGVNKRDFVLRYIQQRVEESGIIYAATRKEVDDCHQFLLKQGLKVGKYHAGMSDVARARSQEQFLYDDLSIMVATNAFGMGIDKSNVRYVIHYNLAKNMEAYYQEAGRAGRDGEPSECVLLFSPQDIVTQKFLIENSSDDDERKTRDYRSLQAMIDYCHTQQCLQSFIIRYFGDGTAKDCGRCIHCRDDREAIDLTEEAKKVCSCVSRMGQRFGVTLTAKVLKGSSDAKVRQFGFDRLTTYGILKAYKEKDIVQMIHGFIADGVLTMSETKYPVISLTAQSVEVLEGRAKVWQKAAPMVEKVGGEAAEFDPLLFEELRRLRKELADRAGVPPFTIFHDATLREMCEKLPVDERSMLAVKGVGEMKYKKYGERFLRILSAYGK